MYIVRKLSLKLDNQMDTKRVKDPITGEFVDGQIVKVIKENNNPIILEMEDEGVLRIKVDIAMIVRTPTPNSLGEPVYVIRTANAISLLNPPKDHAIE